MCNLYVAYFLWFVSGCGALGFHRFYMHKNATGVLWFFTGGLAMVGSIYDLITMKDQVNEVNIRRGMAGLIEGNDERSRSRGVPQASRRERLERTILRVAKLNSGRASASEIALEADIPIEDAKRNLEQLVTKGFAEMRVTKTGNIVYVFPDLLHGDEPLEDC